MKLQCNYCPAVQDGMGQTKFHLFKTWQLCMISSFVGSKGCQLHWGRIKEGAIFVGNVSAQIMMSKRNSPVEPVEWWFQPSTSHRIHPQPVETQSRQQRLLSFYFGIKYDNVFALFSRFLKKRNVDRFLSAQFLTIAIPSRWSFWCDTVIELLYATNLETCLTPKWRFELDFFGDICVATWHVYYIF